ncbi:MAG: PD-(D/E)XK nuclease family protein, partial [Pseudomonadales bacterium]|nr:PD-(D/E)XK nuclease family protein [Pseudomonadales bacterium]
EHQSDKGNCVWRAPIIYPLEDWVECCWQDLIMQGHHQALTFSSLSHSQELLLWEKIIREDQKNALLKPHATAKLAMSANRTLLLWETAISSAFKSHPDCARFALWSNHFRDTCQDQGYVSFAERATHVANAFNDHKLPSPPQILTLGFQQIPPLFSTLLKNTGATLSVAQQKPIARNYFAIACDNVEQELRFAAHWIKEQIRQQPELRISLVVPDLKQRRSQLERIFSAEFEPQSILPANARYQLPYNISAGTSLGDAPIICAALTLLKLQQGETVINDWLKLIRLPFFFEQEEFHPTLHRAELAIRQTGYPALTLDQVHKILLKVSEPDAALSVWLEALQSAGTLISQGKHPLRHWVQVITTLLDIFQWPGNRRLDSIEFQQISRWHNALDEFLLMSEICGDVTWEQALGLLNSFISNIEFQAESARSPIQILGMLEGGGLSFDAIWLIGVNDHVWPPSPSPHPLIPIEVQRASNMPHASADKELAFTQSLFNDYLHSTETLIASYALQDQDQSLRASHLLADFPLKTTDNWKVTAYSHPYYPILYESRILETQPDTQAPELADPKQLLKGGTQVLKNQASCPFKAFAWHRLNAKPLEDSAYHITPQQKGIMLHRALELVWRRLKNTEEMTHISPAELDEVVNNAAASAVLNLAKTRPDLLGDSMIKLEIVRLKELTRAWLFIEEARQPFSVVATEYSAIIQITDTPLRIRIDRIDRLQDGSLLLIDYKTGACSIKDWQGERLEEPQLPLYSLCLETDLWGGDISALAFAQINSDKQGFVGISREENIAAGITSLDKTRFWDMPVEWTELISEWRTRLENLMQSFKAGQANVDPKSLGTCKYCHLSALCRVNDSRSFDRERL